MMAKPEIMTAYTSDLKKLAFDKQKMPPIEQAAGTLENIYNVLIQFEKYRVSTIKNL